MQRDHVDSTEIRRARGGTAGRLSPLLAIAGLVLVSCGAVLAVSAPFGGDRMFCGLALNLLGLTAIYVGFLGSAAMPGPREPRRPRTFGLAAGRLFLGFALLAAAGLILWFGGSDLRDVYDLDVRGRTTDAVVVTRDRVPATSLMGRAYYAYRISGNAIEDTLAIRRADYSDYWTGRPIPVTYLPSNPRLHRIGRVGAASVIRVGIFWFALLLNAAGFLGLPWLLLETSRPPAGRRRAVVRQVRA